MAAAEDNSGGKINDSSLNIEGTSAGNGEGSLVVGKVVSVELYKEGMVVASEDSSMQTKVNSSNHSKVVAVCSTIEGRKNKTVEAMSSDDNSAVQDVKNDGGAVVLEEDKEVLTMEEAQDKENAGKVETAAEEDDENLMETEEQLRKRDWRTAFEIAYGSNPPQYTYEQNLETGEYTEIKTPIEVIVEVNKERVAKAMGMRVESNRLPTSSMEREKLERKRFALIDLSGTLFVDDTVTPNAVLSLMWLRASGYKLLFVTNTTKESKARLYKRVSDLGFVIHIEELFTSMDATRNYVVENNFRPLLVIADEAKEDFAGIDTSDPNCVVVGLSAHDFNRDMLSQISRLVMEKKAPIIAVHKGRSYRSSTGMNLGPGPFVVALERSSQTVAKLLGKPSQSFYEAALKYVGCDDPMEALMIGDDIRDDVYGAMKAGIMGIQVKTGKWTPEDTKKIKPHTPDMICENFAEVVTKLLKVKQQEFRR